jgi:hypothetical protein
MNSTPEQERAESEQKAQSAKRLRALLDDVELAPEQTSDDIAPKTNRDRELLDDVPPHHGNS